MATSKRVRGTVISLVWIGLIAVSVLACFEVQARITYVNDTTLPLTVTVGGEDQFQLNPGASYSLQDLKQAWPATVEARDAAGNVVFSRSYTWEELESLGFRIVITVQPPGPTASATPP